LGNVPHVEAMNLMDY